jgi:hypothetical protein
MSMARIFGFPSLAKPDFTSTAHTVKILGWVLNHLMAR